MKSFRKPFLFLGVFASLMLLSYGWGCADPAVLYFDPGMTHGVFGLDRYPTDAKDWSFDLQLSPFFQHASGSRDKDGNKVPTGDRLGRMEMLAMFWNKTPVVDPHETDYIYTMCASPSDKPYTESNYPRMYKLNKDLRFNHGISELSDDGKKDLYGDYSVSLDYEKIGLRGGINFAMTSGFGLAVKGGLVEYKQTPTAFVNRTPKSGAPGLDAIMTNSIMTFYTRKVVIEQELGLSLQPYETTVFEDTHAQFYWSNPFKFDDDKGSHVVTVEPHVGVGVWIPSGKKKDQDKLFSMPSGHDGFWGVSFEGALNFDFPETILIQIGGGATFFETKTLSGQRVPSHPSQGGGLYPWKAKIKKTFGPGINFNFSFMARNVVGPVSAYFDYIYAKHEQDTITMQECDSTRSACFCPEKLARESFWKSQMIQLGFNYQITPDLSMGVCGQTHISGVRVYKSHTIMGTITFTF